MVPILLKALYLPWRRLDLVHMSHKEILMSYVSVYNDTITKLHIENCLRHNAFAMVRTAPW